MLHVFRFIVTVQVIYEVCFLLNDLREKNNLEFIVFHLFTDFYCYY